MKRVLLVVDVNNWAWHFKAKALKKQLSGCYLIDIVYTSKGTPKYADHLLPQYDHIHFFGWYVLDNIKLKYKNKISTSIASIEYNILRPGQAAQILPQVAVVAVSPVLGQLLRSKGYGRKIHDCFNGVDTDFFLPRKDEQNKVDIPDQKSVNRQFRVGLMCKPPSSYDLHGYKIMEAVRKELAKQPGIVCDFVIANHKSAKSHEDMRTYYQNLDVFIHTGRYHLATPNPVFEAAACGVPIVSTTNGCVPLLVQEGQSGYLIDIQLSDEDKVKQFVQKVLALSKNQELLKSMSTKIRHDIEQHWSWKVRAQHWKPVFDNT